MVSRRSLLAGGAVVGVAAATGGTIAAGKADEVLGALGIDPKALPDPNDEVLAEGARADVDALADLATSQQAPAAVLTALAAMADRLPTATTPAPALTGSLKAACTAQAEARAEDVEQAVSPELAVVLASVAAGLDQCAAVST